MSFMRMRTRSCEPSVDMRRSRSGHGRFAACVLAVGLAVAVPAAGAADAAEPVTRRPPAVGVVQAAATEDVVRGPRVDPAVTPAGGGHAPHGNCRQCRKSACPQCRLAKERHPGHGPCQHGLCPAHCPVRPDVFGFYGTQWRRWPGSDVVQTSNLEGVTPARPPRSVIPRPAEESLDAAATTQPGENSTGADREARPDTTRGWDTKPVPADADDAGQASGRTGTKPAATPGQPDGTPGRPRTESQEEPQAEPKAALKAAEPAAADAEARPREERPNREMPAPPPGSRAKEKSSPAADEDLFNFDDEPRSQPWRSFTSSGRREARRSR